MTTFNPIHELTVLREQLVLNTITSADALEAHKTIHDKSGFGSKWWKETRARLIGSECAQCGKGDPPFTLQHLWHPRKLSDVISPFYDEYKVAHPIEMVIPDSYIDKQVTPCCGRAPSPWVKKRQCWVCPGCKKDCAELKTIQVVDKHGRFAAGQQAGKDRYQEFRDDENYQQRVVITYIDESLRYLSMQDTLTFCKKCAYMWDVKRMRLCTQCKKHYHSMGYKLCYECSGAKTWHEPLVKEAQEREAEIRAELRRDYPNITDEELNDAVDAIL